MKRLLHNIRYEYLLTLVAVFLLTPLISYAEAIFSFEDLGRSVGVLIVEWMGLLTGYGGVLLNYAVEELIIGMGTKYNTEGYGLVIEQTWVIIRDLMNIAFIFGLIYAGVQIILSLNVAQARRTITLIIVGALLVNFSLFFAKVVVEVSNLTANEIYQQISTVRDRGGDPVQIGISNHFFNAMGLFSIYDLDTKEISDRSELENRGFAFLFAAALFLLIAAFVFAAGGILIIIRFIALIFLMIFSPIAFGALAFPGLRRYATQWWMTLFKQAFFAPAMLFLIYISLHVIAIFSNDNAGEFDDFLVGSTATVPILLNFTLAAGFLIASLIIAQKMGAHGASASVKVLNTTQKRVRSTTLRAAGGGSFGLAARLGRTTVGRAGRRITQSKKLQAFAGEKNKNVITKGLARSTMLAGKRTSQASFDARRIGGIGKDLGIGEGKKGGFAQTLKNAEKRHKEIVDMFGENERPYKDRGVEKEFNQYQELVEKRKDTLQELSEATEDSVRKDLAQEVAGLTNQIDDMEKASSIEYGSSKMPEWADSMSEDEWKRMQVFSVVRKKAKDLAQEQYAINLERQGENWWKIFKVPYNLFINNRTANKYAADSIRKNLSKDKQDKLIDAIGSIEIKGGDSTTT